MDATCRENTHSILKNTMEDVADYAMPIKVYRAVADDERKYSPAEVASVEVVPVMGQPDPDRICTPIVERSNLSLRMGTRRCTRLTNAFSKKWENHWAAMSLWCTSITSAGFKKACERRPRWLLGLRIACGTCANSWSPGELLGTPLYQNHPGNRKSPTLTRLGFLLYDQTYGDV
jgi:hypothetical protein